MTIRAYLVALTLAALAPVVILATVLGGFLLGEQRDTFRRGAEERTLAVLTAVDAELTGSIEALAVLSLGKSLDTGDLRLFRDSARKVLASNPNWTNINLALPDGQQILNLQLPDGAELPNIGELDGSFARIRQTGKPMVTDLATGPWKGWGFTVRMPVMRHGELKYVLSAVINPESMSRILRAQRLPADWVGVVLDRNDRIVARTVKPESSTGQLASQSLRDALRRSPSGWFRGETIEGAKVYTPYRRSADTGWAFAMGIPAHAVQAAQRKAIWILALGLAGTIGLAIFLARVIGRRISQPIRELAAATEALAQGRRVAVPESRSATELSSVENGLRAAVDAQEALKRAEEQTRSIVDHVLDGIITIDERGIIESFNRAAERLFGYDASEMIGKNVKLLMPEPYHAGHDGYIDNYLRTGQARIIGIGREVSGRRQDGSTFPMELAVSEFRLGERRCFTGIVRDITERKQAELALQAADRAKDEFLAMLSHELRNPLAAVTTAAHVLRAAAPEDSNIERAQGVIERQTQHMVRLIEDLLDITRVRFGKLSLKREPFDLAELISDVTQSRRAAGALAGRAAVSLDLSSVWTNGDRARLEQVYANLLNNALKFTPAHGAIHVSLRQAGQEGMLRIADNGRGIAADVLPTVFELFVQGEQNLDRPEGGLGLGLALVKRLTELHGGRVTAESGGEGLGATFTVTLPAIAAPRERRPAGARALPGTPEHGFRTLRVLIIEDNQDARQMLRAVLAMEGHEVRDAVNGAAGIQAAAEMNPDVALVDIGLPDLNGYEVARRLRARPGGASMVLVAVSGYGQDDDRGRARQAGFDAHIVKPVSAERLGQLIVELAARNRVTSA